MAGPFENFNAEEIVGVQEVKEDAASKRMLEDLKKQINLPSFKKEKKFKNPALMTEEELKKEKILHAKVNNATVQQETPVNEIKENTEKKSEVAPMYLTNQTVIDRAKYIIENGKTSFADTYGDTKPGGFGGQSVLKYNETDIKRIDEMVTYLINKKYAEQNNTNLGPVTTKENPTYTGENVKDVMYGPDVITKNVLEAIKDPNVLKNTYHVERRFENKKNMYYPIAGYERVYPNLNENYNTKKIEKVTTQQENQTVHLDIQNLSNIVKLLRQISPYTQYNIDLDLNKNNAGAEQTLIFTKDKNGLKKFILSPDGKEGLWNVTADDVELSYINGVKLKLSDIRNGITPPPTQPEQRNNSTKQNKATNYYSGYGIESPQR